MQSLKALKIIMFQSTHPRRVWRFVRSKNFKPYGVSIHTPTKGVTQNRLLQEQFKAVSIHTPTKGVT